MKFDKYILQDAKAHRPSPCGEGGLKFFCDIDSDTLIGPSPCGEGGLKSNVREYADYLEESLPVWGGWIEIVIESISYPVGAVPPRVGRVD